jgi:hypothetical protein
VRLWTLIVEWEVKACMMDVEIRRSLGHERAMDAPTDEAALAWLTDSLRRSEAQIAAGETVPIEPVLERLRASISRMRDERKPSRNLPGKRDRSQPRS